MRVLYFFCILVPVLLEAAFLQVTDLPQVVARGNLSSSAEISRFAPFSNDDMLIVSAAYQLPYGLTEIGRQSLSFSTPLFRRTLYICAQNFGNDVYRENSLSLSYPAYLSTAVTFAPGLEVNYLTTAEKNYLSCGGSLYFLFKPSAELEIISSAVNIAATPMNGENPEADYQLSCRYRPDSSIALYAGIEKDTSTPAAVKVGSEIVFLEKIRLLCGYNFEPVLYTGGFDIKLSSWQFAYAFSYHDVLGLSQTVGLGYQLK